MPTSADFSTMSKSNLDAMRDSNYFNRPTGFRRFAGGFADFLTGNRFDFDKRGKNDEEKEGMFDDLFEGTTSYRPDKRSDTGQLLAMASQRAGGLGMGGNSFQDIGGGVTMFNPSNTARNQAIALRNQQALMAQQKKEENQRMAGQAIGTAVGSAFGPIGAVAGRFLGGAISGIFCDIRLKEDIAPLCKSEVNDVLSECAFFVKNINECS